jgi:hypothetical protein
MPPAKSRYFLLFQLRTLLFAFSTPSVNVQTSAFVNKRQAQGVDVLSEHKHPLVKLLQGYPGQLLILSVFLTGALGLGFCRLDFFVFRTLLR